MEMANRLGLRYKQYSNTWVRPASVGLLYVLNEQINLKGMQGVMQRRAAAIYRSKQTNKQINREKRKDKLRAYVPTSSPTLCCGYLT